MLYDKKRLYVILCYMHDNGIIMMFKIIRKGSLSKVICFKYPVEVHRYELCSYEVF